MMRLRRLREVRGLQLAVAVVVIASGLNLPLVRAAGDRNVPATAAGLQLTITLQKETAVVAGDIPIEWQLMNHGSSTVTVCTWPGIAFSGGWFLADGSFEGFGPGYPDKPELSLLDFSTLKPGESVSGNTSIAAYPTVAGYIRYHATFRSGDDGHETGLRAWRGEIESNVVELKVPKSTP
jgi:hypothetical protein